MLSLRRLQLISQKSRSVSSIPPSVLSSIKKALDSHSHSKFDLPLNNGGLERDDFSARRKKLSEKLAKQTPILGLPKNKDVSEADKEAERLSRQHLVIIPSAQRRYMVDKIPYVFRQATDFRYLTGSKSHDSAVVLRFNGALEEISSTIILPEADPREEKWEGPQLKAEEACEIFGVDHAIHMDDLPGLFELCKSQKNLLLWYDYLNPSHANVHRTVMRFVEGSNVVAQPVQSPRQAVQELRLFKSPKEVEIMRKTCFIGAEALASAIHASSSHQSEAAIFAKIDYESRMRDADFLAYPPVVAAGDHANTIHYTANTVARFQDKSDLILVDAGCDYGGYASDITRTWPLCGKFSPPQKLIYEAVLDVQEKLISCLTLDAGKETVDNLYKKMQTSLGEKMASIGLVSEEVANDPIKLNAACTEFCPHHVSHYLGMDVHDTSLISRNVPLEEGMVITVEPGIYIPLRSPLTSKYLSQVPPHFRGIGVRIEDDVLITRRNKDSLTCEVLSRACPKSVGDIEALVN